MCRAALAALALLVACGEAEEIEISGVARTGNYSQSVFRPGSVGAEVHNAPLPGMTPQQAATLIDLPTNLPEGIDPPYVKPGGWARSEHGKLIRLAVLFNPMQSVDPGSLCAAEGPVEGGPPRSDGFGAAAVLCFRSESLAEGRVDVLAAGEPGEALVRRALSQLMQAMFGGASG